MMGIPYDNAKPYTKLSTCHECGEKVTKRNSVEIEIFDSPWGEEPCRVRVHNRNDGDYGTCFDKLYDTGWADFRYFDCAECGRTVIRQCPFNGWMSYVRENEHEEEICLACYEHNRLENGERLEIFEDGKIPGMFYNSVDLSGHDWALVPGMHGVHITGEDSARRFCDKAIELIGEGYKVLTDFERMAYGGSEGYVSLYAKR